MAAAVRAEPYDRFTEPPPPAPALPAPAAAAAAATLKFWCCCSPTSNLLVTHDVTLLLLCDDVDDDVARMALIPNDSVAADDVTQTGCDVTADNERLRSDLSAIVFSELRLSALSRVRGLLASPPLLQFVSAGMSHHGDQRPTNGKLKRVKTLATFH